MRCRKLAERHVAESASDTMPVPVSMHISHAAVKTTLPMTCRRPVWLAASCCALLLLAPHPAAAAGGALELSDANFESETQASSSDGGPWMIEFYAPYCGHCKAISQAWDDTADSLADKGVKVAKIDGTANRKQAQRFGVRGFPKIMLVKGGVRYDFSGDRTEEALPAQRPPTEEGIAEMGRAQKYVVLVYFS